jgi:hypothetical protein
LFRNPETIAEQDRELGGIFQSSEVRFKTKSSSLARG